MDSAEETLEGTTQSLEPLPWQRAVWQRLLQPALARGQIHHGLMLMGPVGVGKGTLARVIAAALLCEAPQDDRLPCGHCKGCHLFATGAHPDAIQVGGGENTRSSLGVEQIRALGSSLSLSSQYGGARVGILDPADRMTLSAANSLLKTLEEPPARTVLILVASRPATLPATIRSRCQLIPIAPPERDSALQWLGQRTDEAHIGALLEISGGAPLAALALAEDGAGETLQSLIGTLESLSQQQVTVTEAASAWKDKGSAHRLVSWTELLVMDLARGCAAGADWLRIWDSVRSQEWLDRLSLERLQLFLEWLAQTKRALEQPLNDELLAESLFARWRQVVESG